MSFTSIKNSKGQLLDRRPARGEGALIRSLDLGAWLIAMKRRGN